MKTEDFERLKAKLGDEFEIIQDALVSIDGTIAFVRKKDIWDGVEFALNPKGFVRKIEKIEHGLIYFIGDFWYHKNVCKPSTESAYIEQLKKEAFERFGEIKKGDRFKADWINNDDDIDDYCKTSNPNNWTYIKNSDRFFLAKKGGAPIYCEGKWATRVKERVNVGFVWREDRILGEIMPVVAFHDEKAYDENSTVISLLDGKKTEEIAKVFKFLASQLEKYLNGEI